MEILEIMNQLLINNNINYAFERWNKEKVSYPYWIGECDEIEPNEETQLHEFNFRLTGTTRKQWSDLFKDKEKIEKLFFPSLKVKSTNGSGLVIRYTGFSTPPTQEAELKRMQINLTIKEWRTN